MCRWSLSSLRANSLRFAPSSKKGGGLHHLCYEVEDCEKALAAMRQRSAMIVRRPQPAVAFAGRRIAWMLTAEKLLIELLEAGPR